MKVLKILDVIFSTIIVVGTIAIIGVFGGIENECISFIQSIPYILVGMTIVGAACIGLKYVEAKEKYLARRHH